MGPRAGVKGRRKANSLPVLATKDQLYSSAVSHIPD
jgi:hypothetical protein